MSWKRMQSPKKIEKQDEVYEPVVYISVGVDSKLHTASKEIETD